MKPPCRQGSVSERSQALCAGSRAGICLAAIRNAATPQNMKGFRPQKENCRARRHAARATLCPCKAVGFAQGNKKHVANPSHGLKGSLTAKAPAMPDKGSIQSRHSAHASGSPGRDATWSCAQELGLKTLANARESLRHSGSSQSLDQSGRVAGLISSIWDGERLKILKPGLHVEVAGSRSFSQTLPCTRCGRPRPPLARRWYNFLNERHEKYRVLRCRGASHEALDPWSTASADGDHAALRSARAAQSSASPRSSWRSAV
jgi:hypothetical protein